jgi:hypothetical protein
MTMMFSLMIESCTCVVVNLKIPEAIPWIKRRYRHCFLFIVACVTVFQSAQTLQSYSLNYGLCTL